MFKGCAYSLYNVKEIRGLKLNFTDFLFDGKSSKRAASGIKKKKKYDNVRESFQLHEEWKTLRCERSEKFFIEEVFFLERRWNMPEVYKQ